MKSLLLSLLIVVLTCGYYIETTAQGFTVRHVNYLADSLMHLINPDARLLTIASDSTFFGGASISWHYKYGYWNGESATYYFLHTTLNSVVYDSSNNIQWIGITTITFPWIDSDSAWVIAEAQGGSNFRLFHPHNKISAGLAEAIVPNARPFWDIVYRSLDDPSVLAYFLINATDSSQISRINPLGNAELKSFMLYQNYPNPFNPTTKIEYSLPLNGHVKLQVFSVTGQLVKTLVDENQNAGYYSINFSGTKLSSGTFLYRLSVNNKNIIKKMLYLK